ncbi:MAG: hypothetical protein KZQ89_04780 [Candidatus Thiodiazotropha sp. (ex Lucinoma kastoroae)]|nr:hypothetical protein [Candidatus Thiodiazotropha sp. (ex Lucinoma kastoroae)]MCU7859042.1 hypothetical protein [Candidatus Thiodiazotropha sp. (ex Lucinoma kastoroae)]
MILDSSVEHCEGCGCGGAGQDTTTRNSCSIVRSCNAAMRHHKRTIRGVAMLINKVDFPGAKKVHNFNLFGIMHSGQLRILG